MIRVSNLRKEHLPESGECRIVCDIDCGFSSARQLWVSVPEKYGDWLTDDVYDAFMIAMLYPAMYYKENLVIDGCVSEKLFDYVTKYVQRCEQAYIGKRLSIIDIQVAGFKEALKTDNLIGAGFTAGIDAFTTLYDRYVLEEKPNFKLSALFFFNVGTHGGGGEKARKKFMTRYNYLLPLTQEVGLPFVPMDSNLFDFYLFEWEYDAGVLCRAFGILAFERVLKKYYIAYDYSFWEIVHMTSADYASITDMTNYHHLGTENLEIIVDGTQYRRSEKTEKLLQYPPFMHYVNVCVGNVASAKNCSLCHKCMRTQLTLDILNRLDDFEDVFFLDKFRKKRFAYKCQTVVQRKTDIYALDNCELAKRMNYPMPPYFVAWLYMFPRIMKRKLRMILNWALRRNGEDERHYPL